MATLVVLTSHVASRRNLLLPVFEHYFNFAAGTGGSCYRQGQISWSIKQL